MCCLTSILFFNVFSVVLCWFFRIFVARWSAVSFQGMPVWEGIHERVVLVPDELRLAICLIISGMAGLESHLKLEIAWTADLESVNMVAESVSQLLR